MAAKLVILASILQLGCYLAKRKYPFSYPTRRA
jgi:hypothetical protein